MGPGGVRAVVEWSGGGTRMPWIPKNLFLTTCPPISRWSNILNFCCVQLGAQCFDSGTVLHMISKDMYFYFLCMWAMFGCWLSTTLLLLLLVVWQSSVAHNFLESVLQSELSVSLANIHPHFLPPQIPHHSPTVFFYVNVPLSSGFGVEDCISSRRDVMWLLCVHVCVWSGGTLSKCIDQTLCVLHRLLGVYHA